MKDKVTGIHLKILIIVFLITRLLFLLMGVNIRRDFLPVRFYDIAGEHQVFGPLGTVLHGWDSGWYLQIAENGYKLTTSPDPTKLPYVFFPLYPALIRILSFVFGNAISAGFFVSNVCFLAAGIVLYKLILFKKDRNVAFMTAIVLFVFPGNYIFSGIQSESLFLFLLLLSFYYLEKKSFLTASLFGALLALTRNVGFLIVVPTFYYAIKHFGRNNLIKPVLYSLIPLLGLAVYCIYLYVLTGDFLAFITLQKGWDRSLNVNILSAVSILIQNSGSLLLQANFWLAVIIGLLAVLGAFKLGWPYVFICLVYWAIYFSSNNEVWHLFSLPRYFVVLFPAYYYLGQLISKSRLLAIASPGLLWLLGLMLFSFWTLGMPIPM